MAAKRILTWAPNWSKRGGGGRWKKVVDGKTWFFGHGESDADTRSYREAERKYLEFMQRRETCSPVEVVVSEATVFDVAEKYIQEREGEYQRGEISAAHISKTHGLLQRFVDFIGPDRRFVTISEIDLNDFRQHVLSRPPTNVKSPSRGRKISLHTAREILYVIKALIYWAYELRLCDQLPRNLRKFTAVQLPRPTIKTFSVEEVRLLWNTADERLRCFIALAVNCGYGAKDISDLKINEVNWETGIIDRDRSKTGIRQRHKLWPVTLDLLMKSKLQKPGPEGRLFKTAEGLPLVHDDFIDGKRKKSDAVKCLFWRAQRRTGINGKRGFYCLRKTGATEIEKINPLVTEMYLAHTEKGQKRHYAERTYTMLDAALEEMRCVFNLSISAIPTAQAA